MIRITVSEPDQTDPMISQTAQGLEIVIERQVGNRYTAIAKLWFRDLPMCNSLTGGIVFGSTDAVLYWSTTDANSTVQIIRD